MYAEAQRRKEDNKEFAAALTALMFNIYQMMRTIMGWVQLNAFVAWCKHAVECIRALDRNDSDTPASESAEGRGGDKKRRMAEIVAQWQKVIVLWCKRESNRMCTFLRRDGENTQQRRDGDEENRESSVRVNVDGNGVDGVEDHLGASPGINEEYGNAEAEADLNVCESGQSVEHIAEGRDSGDESNAESIVSRGSVDDGNGIEKKIMVNNMVVDNELGGREVTVLPSWEKIRNGIKEGRFTPGKWLRTDRVILNTVRWGGAYLCGVGEDWSVGGFGFRTRKESSDVSKSFFSRDMHYVRRLLQEVEWNMSMENEGSEFLTIYYLGSDDIVDLTGEMSTAYGSRLKQYDVEDTFTVDAFSFEFNSLVGSYPSGGHMYSTANRERIGVGLVHSVLLAKHLGVEKLQAIRRYYDRYHLPEGAFLRNAFNLLLKQTNTPIPDDARIWKIFKSNDYQIPIFPYRMQLVALWDEATNWRVPQASAHYDYSSALFVFELQTEEEHRVLKNAPHPVNIFDTCAEWTIKQLHRNEDEWIGSLGVVMETVRTFLAEWVTASAREMNWEPDVPTVCVKFNTGEIRADHFFLPWTCQRELQKKVAKLSREEENFPGNAALIMLFLLGFPILKMVKQETVVGAQDSQDSGNDAKGPLPSNTHRTIDLSVEVWRTWTPLAPQYISLVIQLDKRNRTASLRLQNDSGEAQFKWQDWVDAAMGCMKGFEEFSNGKFGYGRKIVRAELGKPMVELCPLLVDKDGIEPVVRRTSTARVWTGWPAFDVRICKFEVDQWFDACGLDIRADWVSNEVVESVEGVVEAIVFAKNEQVEKSTQSDDV